MKRILTHLLVIIPCLLGGGTYSTGAQTTDASPAPPPSAPARRSAADLEKLAMPIALHPDPLIAILLPAAAYPVEIVQAARFVKDTNNLARLDQQPWDENVKNLARFPDLIAKMDADLSWTIELGQAFIDQPKDLMDAIQSLRVRAQQAGTLQNTPQQVVTVTNTIVQIQPANPQVIYVPTYPTTVYYPPPNYVYDPYAPLIGFGAGLAVGIIIGNNCDWHGGCVWWGGGYYHGDVDVDIDIDRNVNRPERPAQRPGDRTRPAQQQWRPDQNRLRTSGAPTSPQARAARGWSGAATGLSQRPATGMGGARPSQLPSAATTGARPAQQPSSPAASSRPATARPQPATARPPQTSKPSTVNRPANQPASAFSGISSGNNARNYSNRGAVSRGGGGGGGFRGGGGGGRRR